MSMSSDDEPVEIDMPERKLDISDVPCDTSTPVKQSLFHGGARVTAESSEAGIFPSDAQQIDDDMRKYAGMLNVRWKVVEA